MGSDLDLDAMLGQRFRLPTNRPFLFQEALDLKVSARQLAELCKRGLVRKLVKGVYVAAIVPDSLELRCNALKLVVPPSAVVTDRTAGWLHGAEMILAPNSHLAVPPVSMFVRARGCRLRNGLTNSGQRMMPDGDVEEIHGLLVTSRIRTTLDLGRLLPRDQAFAGMDSMLGLGGFAKEEMLVGVERFKGCRGVRQLRALAPLTDARSQSPGESVLRLRWLDCADLPRPQPQVPVPGPGGSPYWLDLGVDELRFGAEYDGEEWHGEDRREHDDARRAWITEHGGWDLVVLRKEHVFGPRQCADLILRAGVLDALRRLAAARP